LGDNGGGNDNFLSSLRINTVVDSIFGGQDDFAGLEVYTSLWMDESASRKTKTFRREIDTYLRSVFVSPD
jgi:hypothetical protein